MSGYGTWLHGNDEMGGAVDRLDGRLVHGWGQAPALQGRPSPPLDSGAVSGYGECFGRDDRPWGRFLVLRWAVGDGIAIDVLSRKDGAWIPTAAGMTNGRPVAAGARRYEIWVCCTIRPDRLQ